MRRKKTVHTFLLVMLSVCTGHAQQIPSYSFFPNYNIAYNPAFTGTKTNLNVLMDYRNQWTGFEGAPVTQGIMIDSRLLQGKMGFAGSMTSDETGPWKRMVYGASSAFHIHFPDVELSLGAQGSMNKTYFDGRLTSTHNTGDLAIDRMIQDYAWIPNASAGVLLYNDRFHFGLSALNLIGNRATYFKADSLKRGHLTMSANYYFTVGYNFNANPDFIWQNSMIVMYTKGSAINLEYNLKLHCKNVLFFGTDIRLSDAIALQAGVVLYKMIQIGYSYDLVTMPIRMYQHGTHEVVLAFKTTIGKKNKYGKFDEFQRQKYHLF